MATIPRALDLVGPAQNTRRVVGVPVVEESTAGARALAQAGKALSDFGARLYEADVDRKTTQANRQTREELDREYRKLEESGDIKPEEFETRFREASDAVIARNAEIVPKGGRGMWTERAKSEWQADGLFKSRSLTRTRQLETAQAGLIEENAKLGKMAGDLSLSEETVQESLQAQRNTIERQRQGGIIGDDVAAKLNVDIDNLARKDTISRKQSRIDGLARTGQTAEAVKLIEQSGTFEERDSLYRVLEAVETEQYQKRERARIEKDRALTEINKTASKDMDDRIIGGNLTKGWLQTNRNRLSEEDYTRGARELGNLATGDVKSNPAIFADLTYRSAAGEDVSGQVMRAMSEGLLSKTDAGSLLASSGGNVEQPSWSKRGLEFISNSLKPSDLNDDPFRNLRYAQAVEEWRDYVDRQTTPPDRGVMQKELDAIVKSYSLIESSSEMALALPAPRTLGRRPQSTAELNEAKQRLATSDMSNEDLAREIELLQRWEKALKASPQ